MRFFLFFATVLMFVLAVAVAIASIPMKAHAGQGALGRLSVEGMKVLHSLLLISLLSASALAEDKVEETHDLGGGFRFDTLAVKSSGKSFESFGHFRYLFYRAAKLSQTDAAAVSPSGKRAVYQDGPTGDLYLFEAVNGHKTLLRKSPHALVQTFHWADDEKSADAELEGGVDLTLEVPAAAPAPPKKK